MKETALSKPDVLTKTPPPLPPSGLKRRLLSCTMLRPAMKGALALFASAQTEAFSER